MTVYTFELESTSRQTVARGDQVSGRTVLSDKVLLICDNVFSFIRNVIYLLGLSSLRSLADEPNLRPRFSRDIFEGLDVSTYHLIDRERYP